MTWFFLLFLIELKTKLWNLFSLHLQYLSMTLLKFCAILLYSKFFFLQKLFGANSKALTFLKGNRWFSKRQIAKSQMHNNNKSRSNLLTINHSLMWIKMCVAIFIKTNKLISQLIWVLWRKISNLLFFLRIISRSRWIW
jgi:hypothetical protein